MPRPDAISFSDLLAKHNIPTATPGQSKHVRPGWIGIECVFCGKGTGKFGMGYNLATGYITCWKCGPHKMSEVLGALLDLPEKQARRLSMAVIGPRRAAHGEEIERPVGGRYLPPGYLGPLLPAHRNYLAGRGFDPDQLEEEWGVKGIGVAAQLAWRVFIPILFGGEAVSWSTRAISEMNHPKYISAARHQEKVHHKDFLFGEDKCTHTIVVNEGWLDALAIGPGGTATCGVGYTRSQMTRIAKYPVRVILFDNEYGAQKRARQLCAELEPLPGVTHNVKLETGKDASRAQQSELRELRKRFLE